VPLDRVRANDWNPNRTAPRELYLLAISIRADGFTQPVVTVRDTIADLWIVVDGFHRWRVAVEYEDIRQSTDGMLPVVELVDRTPNDLMASTVRHNRARGKHQVAGMGQLVFELLENGWNEAEVCVELGMEADEVIRLKHVTGFSRLFADQEYRRAWETKRMGRLRREWAAEHPEDPTI
jgi:ParB-like chromosome segregation protein Spo0J